MVRGEVLHIRWDTADVVGCEVLHIRWDVETGFERGEGARGGDIEMVEEGVCSVDGQRRIERGVLLDIDTRRAEDTKW